MQTKRVVITGLGVVAPNAVGIDDFTTAIKHGQSGIRFIPELAALNFGCQVGGMPPVTEAHKVATFSPLTLKTLKASGIMYGVIAGLEAWKMAGLSLPEADTIDPDWDSGCIFGAGLAGAEVMRDATYLIDRKQVKKLGSTSVQQVMSSGISAHLGGRLGLGNLVTTNAAACSTGTEGLLLAYDRIVAGKAKRILCGSCDSSGPYVWGGFDAMRVTNRKHNHDPEGASRPMSATASGIIPGGGAGALVLEDLAAARERGANIYAEILGGYANSGGQRNGGTMTAPNSEGIIHCICRAVEQAGIGPEELDAISGHLTATLFDPHEIANWTKALQRRGDRFPYINALKSMIGHCLSAAGSIESVAVVLQLKHGFLHPSLNCEDLHPDIADSISQDRIPRQFLPKRLNVMAKSSFGFGDVNSCVIFKKFSEND